MQEGAAFLEAEALYASRVEMEYIVVCMPRDGNCTPRAAALHRLLSREPFDIAAGAAEIVPSLLSPLPHPAAFPAAPTSEGFVAMTEVGAG